VRNCASLVAVILLVSLLPRPAASQDAPSAPPIPYPTKDDYQSYVKYIEDLRASFRDRPSETVAWEPFDGLVRAGRDEGVYQLAKALHDTMPELKYLVVESDFRNPVILAYEAGRFDLVKRLISLDKGLLGYPETTMNSYGRVPLAAAVARGDIAWAQAFIDAGASLDTQYVRASMDEVGYPDNLYTISPSKAMDDFLAGKQVKPLYVLEDPASGNCNDDNVRLRSSPSTQGAVIAKLMRGDRFEVLASTYKRETIGDFNGCWVEVSYKGQKGWIFQQFVKCNFFDLE
jgi:hypothetical protein